MISADSQAQCLTQPEAHWQPAAAPASHGRTWSVETLVTGSADTTVASESGKYIWILRLVTPARYRVSDLRYRTSPSSSISTRKTSISCSFDSDIDVFRLDIICRYRRCSISKVSLFDIGDHQPSISKVIKGSPISRFHALQTHFDIVQVC
jgi:hypothetical protein